MRSFNVIKHKCYFASDVIIWLWQLFFTRSWLIWLILFHVATQLFTGVYFTGSLTVIRAWNFNHIRCLMLNVISHPCLDSNPSHVWFYCDHCVTWVIYRTMHFTLQLSKNYMYDPERLVGRHPICSHLTKMKLHIKTHLLLVPHICVSQKCQHLLR